MANQPALFKQADVSRALKGAMASGLEVSGFKIDREGSIIVELGSTAKQEETDNGWDVVLDENSQ